MWYVVFLRNINPFTAFVLSVLWKYGSTQTVTHCIVVLPMIKLFVLQEML